MPRIRIHILTFLVAAFLVCSEAQSFGRIATQQAGSQNLPVGPLEGSIAPRFTAVDQFGKQQSDRTIAGKNGMVLFFFRSADWSPFCKMQLVRLQKAQQTFKDHGIGLAAISYDTQAILKDFADHRHIAVPLLADPESEIIQKFNVLEASPVVKGIAHPGFIYISSDGRVKEKFFEAFYTDSYTPNSLLGKLFPDLTELPEQTQQTVDAPHIGLALGQSDRIVLPGNVVTLTADVSLDHDMHVYAPDTKSYMPIELVLEPNVKLMAAEAVYPTPKILFLKPIKDRAPVYGGKFRITRDIKIIYAKTLLNSLKETRTITITGMLKYQACDEKTCYPPVSVPVQWEIRVMQLELQRSPPEIQRHPKS